LGIGVTVLFALSSTTSEANKPLVSFRAGKCTFANNTVTPIPKKGLVQLTQTPDSLIHFQWKDRASGTLEDDLIIFPEEAAFSKVAKGTTGRVFILKFKTSDRKIFFWMQEPKDDKDKEYEEKINQYINNPPVPDQSASGADVMSGGDQQLQQVLQRSSVDGQPALNVTATQAPSPSSPAASPAPAQTVPTPSTAPVSSHAAVTPVAPTSSIPQPATQVRPHSQQQPQLNLADIDFSSILAGYGVPQQGVENIDLAELMSPENLMPILLKDPASIQILFPYLPEEERNKGLPALRELLYSPQFQQGVELFAQVVSSGQGNELLRQFGVDPMKAGPLGVLDINGFFQALQQSIIAKPK